MLRNAQAYKIKARYHHVTVSAPAVEVQNLNGFKIAMTCNAALLNGNNPVARLSPCHQKEVAWFLN